jgi:hypothetical protein
MEKNPSVTKIKDTLQPLQTIFCDFFCRFVVTEFVKTCDELVKKFDISLTINTERILSWSKGKNVFHYKGQKKKAPVRHIFLLVVNIHIAAILTNTKNYANYTYLITFGRVYPQNHCP